MPYKHPLDSPAPAVSSAPIRRVLVFCGSRHGVNSSYAEGARALGELFAERGIGIVYGGGALGLMGEIARASLAKGGKVEGVIPHFLRDWEVAEPLCEDMVVTDSLHSRKQVMFSRADAVLALPGGLGTLDELAEVLSWRSLRLHSKPIWLLGQNDFWQPFLRLVEHMVDEGFASRDILGYATPVKDVDALAAMLPAS